MKPTRTVSSYVLLVGMMGLSIVGGILAYQIYSASTKSQTTTEQKEAIKSIDGSIDAKIIENMQKRVVFSEVQMDNSLRAVPTPEITEAAGEPTATASATTE